MKTHSDGKDGIRNEKEVYCNGDGGDAGFHRAGTGHVKYRGSLYYVEKGVMQRKLGKA